MEKIPGCSFKARCPFAVERCTRMEYALKDIGNRHYVMCTKFQ
jgi:ABC-type dipeptide/oligopeptide/nickel transport system ATPase component